MQTHISIDDELKRLLIEEAKSRGLCLSAFLRMCALKEAKKIQQEDSQ